MPNLPVHEVRARKRTVRGWVARVSLIALIPTAPIAFLAANPAGAIDSTQLNAAANEDCGVYGLHSDSGYTSTCYDASLQSEVLINGVDVAEQSWTHPGDIITVRLTVVTEGGQLSLYEEAGDGLKRNEAGGKSDIRAQIGIRLPAQTGAALGTPTNVRMSRTDAGDRGNAPGTLCSSQALDEPAKSDGLTNITLGATPVGVTDMSAVLSSGNLKATWDDMAWDRCRGALSRNAIYAGHVIEFEQTVATLGVSVQSLTWNFGQFVVARDNMARTLTWGRSSDHVLRIPADADSDLVASDTDPDDADACIPDLNAGNCDRDKDGQTNDIDVDDIDPCEISTGLSTFPGCDSDGDGVPSGTVAGSNGIPSINGAAVDPDDADPCSPDLTAGPCDRDGDGEKNSIDTDDTDPCQISTGISTYPGCDPDGDGIPSSKIPGSNGIPGVNGGATDADDANACNPDPTTGKCDRDGDGQINSVDPDDTDPCEISTGISTYPGCDDDGDGIPSGSITGSNGLATTKLVDSASSNPCVPNANSTRCLAHGSGFFKVTPKRLLDSRYGLSTTKAKFGPGETRTLKVAGLASIPSTATAVVLNVTATRTTASTGITVWAGGSAMPSDPSLRTPSGRSRPSIVIAALGSGGTVSIRNASGYADIVIDVFGYFASGGAGMATTSPNRLVDTRYGIGTAKAAFASGENRTIQVGGTATVPMTATAVVVNLTSTRATAGSYLTVWPSGLSRPVVSTLNWSKGETSPNLAIVPLSASGSIDVYNYVGSTDVVMDVVGYFGPNGTDYLRSTEPAIALDTQVGVGTTGGALSTAESIDVTLTQSGTVPNSATGVLGSLTIASTTASSTYLTVWPAGETRPATSSVNSVVGDSRVNGVIGRLSAGTLSVYASRGDTHARMSISGWFGPNTSA